MAVLESSASDLTPAQVAAVLRDRGNHIDVHVVEARLEQLRAWGAASARSDQTHVRRVQDLLRRNFRYTATRQGRQVQRFYETVLAGTPVMREIPLQSLNAVVVALESLAAGGYRASNPTTQAGESVPPTPWEPNLAEIINTAGTLAFEEGLMGHLMNDLRQGSPQE